MDEDRWSHSWLKNATRTRTVDKEESQLSQRSNESGAGTTMAEASVSESKIKTSKNDKKDSVPVVNDRYKADVLRAESLRRTMRPRKDDSSKVMEDGKGTNSNNLSSSKDGRRLISEEDVLLGLKALDEADEMRQRGELEMSLRVGELALELLIELLKSDPKLVPSVDRGFVASRVQVALSDAEATKHHLKGTSSSLSPSSSSSPTSLENKKTGVVQSLSATLSNLRSRKQGSIKKTSTSPSSSSVQSTGQPSSQPPKKKTAILNQTQQQQQPQRKSSARPSVSQSSGVTSDQSAPAPSKSVPSAPFLNNNDPLVATIKSDLYVDPSQLQDTSWDDIAGLSSAKQALQEAAILPLMRPDLFTGLRKPRNILLYGPPGTGKTMLVRAVAKESQCLLFICTASALTSKWHGEGEKLVRTLFEVARAAAPSIIFIDEMDALLSSRKSEGEHEASRRFKTEMMTQMDGIVKGGGGGSEAQQQQQHVLIIACTNTPWDLDSAILRRFSRRIYIPLPDPSTRKALFQKLLSKAGGKHNLSKADLTTLIKRTKGFSGSDLASLASEASFGPLRSLGGMDAIRGADAKDIRPISLQDFETAIDQSTKSVSPQLLKQYDEWKSQQAAS